MSTTRQATTNTTERRVRSLPTSPRPKKRLRGQNQERSTPKSSRSGPTPATASTPRGKLPPRRLAFTEQKPSVEGHLSVRRLLLPSAIFLAPWAHHQDPAWAEDPFTETHVSCECQVVLPVLRSVPKATRNDYKYLEDHFSDVIDDQGVSFKEMAENLLAPPEAVEC